MKKLKKNKQMHRSFNEKTLIKQIKNKYRKLISTIKKIFNWNVFLITNNKNLFKFRNKNKIVLHQTTFYKILIDHMILKSKVKVFRRIDKINIVVKNLGNHVLNFKAVKNFFSWI